MPAKIPWHKPRRAPGYIRQCKAAQAKRQAERDRKTVDTRAEADAAYRASDERRSDNKFYCSRRWRSVRLSKLARNPCCEDCEAKGIATPATEVHHIKSRKAHPSLELDLDNLRSLCKPCHQGQSRRRGWSDPTPENPGRKTP